MKFEYACEINTYTYVCMGKMCIREIPIKLALLSKSKWKIRNLKEIMSTKKFI